MTNEEKREYLNLKIAYQSTPFVAELEKRNEYIKKTPKSLYKYRNFDEYTIDMIENDYVFLAPTGCLDDPFECLTSVDLDRIFDNDRKIVIEADVRNIGSNKVIKKCGFSFTHKEEKEHCSQFKPEPIAVNWYEIKKRRGKIGQLAEALFGESEI